MYLDAFTATVMQMLIMALIRGRRLSCKANFVLLQATGRMGLSSLSMQMEKSCRVDVYSYKQNQFADTVETSEESEPTSVHTVTISESGPMMESV